VAGVVTILASNKRAVFRHRAYLDSKIMEATSQPILPRNTLWLLLPPIALCVLDFGLTLYGQSDAYWAGDYSVVNEMSPSFGHFLSLHPMFFLAAAGLWIAIFSAIILLLPEAFALTVLVAIVIGHMAGAATWLAYRFHSYQSCNVLFFVTSGLIVVAFKCGQNADGRSAVNWERTGLPGWARWLVIAALATLPTWWFLIPH
jgi:hypothetical protein